MMKLDEAEKKWLRRFMWIGVALGVICNCLPHGYRVVCETIANICRGG